MKNKHNERKLLVEDLSIYNSYIRQFVAITSHIFEVRKAYNKLEIGDFNDDVFKEIINSGIGQIEKKYMAGLNSNLDSLGITNQQMRSNILADTQLGMNELKSAVNALVRGNSYASILGSPVFPMQLITIVDGVPILRDEDHEAIKENLCRKYISTEQEFSIYNAIQELTQSYNRMLEVFEKTGYRAHFELQKLSSLVSENNDNTLSIKPDSVALVMNCDVQYRQAMSFSNKNAGKMADKAA